MLLKRLWPGVMAAAPLQQSLTHTTSLCIVPPDDSPEWRAVQATRLEMRDAGIYRWPPHCNLIYPFAAKPRLAAVDVRRDELSHVVARSPRRARRGGLAGADVALRGGRRVTQPRGALRGDPRARERGSSCAGRAQIASSRARSLRAYVRPNLGNI